MFTKYGCGYRSTIGFRENEGESTNDGSATGQLVGIVGLSNNHTTLPNSTRNPLIEVFPVYYPDNFDRSDEDLHRGERTIEIWFGNSFSNPRPNAHDHDAIDIMTPIGLPVFFTSRQTVVNQWPYDGESRAGVSTSRRGGNSVRAIDSQGYIHYYAHLRDSSVAEVGQTYQAGEILGYSGDTGIARGNAHLHYQVRSPRQMQRRNRYSMIISINGIENIFHSRGRSPINTYDDLVRLALLKSPQAERRGRHSSQYKLPIPNS